MLTVDVTLSPALLKAPRARSVFLFGNGTILINSSILNMEQGVGLSRYGPVRAKRRGRPR